MSGCDILNKLEEFEKAKDFASTWKEMKAQSQPDLRQKLGQWKEAPKYNREEGTMANLKQCPICFSVTKLGCS